MILTRLAIRSQHQSLIRCSLSSSTILQQQLRRATQSSSSPYHVLFTPQQQHQTLHGRYHPLLSSSSSSSPPHCFTPKTPTPLQHHQHQQQQQHYSTTTTTTTIPIPISQLIEPFKTRELIRASADEQLLRFMDECFDRYDMDQTPELHETFLHVLEEFAANRGAIDSLKMLGSMYATGKLGVPVDVVAAFKYYLEAAERGNDAEAQFFVARFYFSALKLLLTNSVEEAMNDRYDMMAELSKDPTVIKTEDDEYVYVDPKMQLKMQAAELQRAKIDYSTYPGLSKRTATTKLKESSKLGLYYLEKAAQNDHTKAQMLLARFYMDGREMEANLKVAFGLMQRAAEKNDAGAYYNLGTLYYTGVRANVLKDKLPEGVSSTCMSPEDKLIYYETFEIPQDVNKAIEYFKRSAELDDPVALYWLGYSLIHGQDMEKDVKQGVQLVNRACQLGHPQAFYYMYLLYSEGQEVPKNEQFANEMFQAALEANSSDAKYDLADRCLRGTHGERKDARRAFTLYEEAGKLGNGYALFCLGSMYYHGIGTGVDYRKAHERYSQAVGCGVKEAFVPLARMTIKGEGVDKPDEKYGRYLLELAKEAGVEFDESMLE